MSSSFARRLLPACLLVLLAWLVYRPGLSGGFLFDDYVNLDVLANEDPLSGIGAFLRYLTSGQADPTGRPVAMLSFLLDARAWPADPAPFLRTNLLIHLANGLLLAAVLGRLGAAVGADDEDNRWSSLLGAGLWLLHPLFVSTTLYVVQRAAMLSATFALVGMLAYLHGRAGLLASGGRTGRAWMIAGVVGGTVLAGLSKANGFLLPALILLLEWVLLPGASGDAAAPLRQLRRWLLWPPTLALGLVLAWYGLGTGAYGDRAFTVGERLLSEGRALAQYLRLLVVPSANSDGLFNDGFVASSSWLRPATTLPSALLVLALVGAGLALRRRSPCWSAAILFFFLAHSLESSVIPLELYFEHRNYFPSLLLFWPLAREIQSLRLARHWRYVLALGLLALLAATSYQRAATWGDPRRMAATWVISNPGSSRAIAASSILMRQAGHPESAVALLEKAWLRSPDDVQVGVNYVESRCAAGQLQAADLRRLGAALARTREEPMLAYRWLDDAIGPAPGFACRLPVAEVRTLVEIVAANPAFVRGPQAVQNLESLRARLALEDGDVEAAAKHFRASLGAYVRPEVAAAQAALLIRAGYHRAAMAHLDYFDSLSGRVAQLPPGMRRVHDWLLFRQGYWREVFAALRAAAASEGPER